MTCRHSPGDPACSSSPEGRARADAEAHQYREKKAKERVDELLSRTPNPDDYEFVELEQVGPHLVAMVQYSSCTKCSFDAKKVMVFFNRTMKDAAFWNHIDPHFNELGNVMRKIAPPPRARFPADDEGWQDALEFARSKA